MTAKSMNDFANSDANVNRLLRQIAEQRRRINDRDISLQRPINDLLHQANMLCTIVEPVHVIVNLCQRMAARTGSSELYG